MNKRQIIASGVIAIALAGGAVACSSQPAQVDVLQYGYYTPAHVYVAYPQPIIAHVSYNTWHSDSRMYSTPTYEKTYIKTHTVIRSTTTTVNRGSGPVSTIPNRNTTKTTTTVQHSTTTTTRKK